MCIRDSLSCFSALIYQKTHLFWGAFLVQTTDKGRIVDPWEDRLYTIEEIEVMLKSKKEAALKREKALAYALSQQVYQLPSSFPLPLYVV